MKTLLLSSFLSLFSSPGAFAEVAQPAKPVTSIKGAHQVGKPSSKPGLVNKASAPGTALRGLSRFSLEIEETGLAADPVLTRARLEELVRERLEERGLPLLSEREVAEIEGNDSRAYYLKRLSVGVVLQRTAEREVVGLIRLRLIEPSVISFGSHNAKVSGIGWEDGGVVSFSDDAAGKTILEESLLARIDALAEAFHEANPR